MNLRLEDTPINSAKTTKRLTAHDTLHRPLQDLRISVIDQCNFRCNYCMPAENYADHYTFLKENDWLTFEEIERLARLFVRLGVTKLRLTGGEPLLRPSLSALIKKLRSIDGIEDLALTTNGSLLAVQAPALKSAGLDRITVSLDALDDKLFRIMNGQRGSVDKVLEGIKKCEALGFKSIKINTVLQKGVNEHQALDLVKCFKGRKPILRFIEYMDVGNCNHWDPQLVVPSTDIAAAIHAHFPMEPIDPNYYGEVAKRYRFLDGGGEVGFISSITQPFCRTCTRARLSTDGKVYTCLFARNGADLRASLRHNASDDQLLDQLRSIWSKRDDRYSELRTQKPAPEKSPPKVEMFQIGG
jgi:cyclic pyranopterin phosphate synthase